jgi:hypothetical protein
VLSRRRRELGGERGSAVVEFALVLPLLLLVSLAIVQVGIVARDQLLVVEAARAGAREASIDLDGGAVRSAALAAAPSLDRSRVEISVRRAGGLGEPVVVTVGYGSTIAAPLVGLFLPSEVRLTATATMRQEFG